MEHKKEWLNNYIPCIKTHQGCFHCPHLHIQCETSCTALSLSSVPYITLHTPQKQSWSSSSLWSVSPSPSPSPRLLFWWGVTCQFLMGFCGTWFGCMVCSARLLVIRGNKETTWLSVWCAGLPVINCLSHSPFNIFGLWYVNILQLRDITVEIENICNMWTDFVQTKAQQNAHGKHESIWNVLYATFPQ